MTSMRKSKKAKNISGHRLREIKAILKKGRHELNSETIEKFSNEFKLHAVKPLYSMQDAENTLEIIDGKPYKTPVTAAKNTTCTFYDAGHILGSSMNLIKSKENGKTYNILHSGDIGRFDKPIINDPTLQFAEEDQTVRRCDDHQRCG